MQMQNVSTASLLFIRFFFIYSVFFIYVLTITCLLIKEYCITILLIMLFYSYIFNIYLLLIFIIFGHYYTVG